MKYYIIAGEASGDLHAAHLMAALKQVDPKAEFRYYGGDCMQAQGGTLVKHYKQTAYMGFVQVLLHLPTILRNLSHCKDDILRFAPHVVILVDYPGFNLKIAEFVHSQTHIPVFYYISPKIWAWKEHRIENIKRDVDQLFSILPFEVPYFEHRCFHIHYVGNPTVDEVAAFKAGYHEPFAGFCQRNGLNNKPIIALLAGSRLQEISQNLPRMLDAASSFIDHYQLVVAGAPSITLEEYQKVLGNRAATVIFNETYPLLSHSTAALVTSGTATLETALFGVPQVVCYYMSMGWLVKKVRPHFLHVKYISLVNLVVNKWVVPELVGSDMNVTYVRGELERLLPGGDGREAMLQGYAEMVEKLGEPGAPMRAASLMCRFLHKQNPKH